MAKSGWADILELLFWTGMFEILAKTLADVYLKMTGYPGNPACSGNSCKGAASGWVMVLASRASGCLFGHRTP